MFNQAVEAFEHTLQEGKTYFISNGTIKSVNKRFASAHDRIELYLNVGSVITEVEDNDAINNYIYKFTTLEEFENSSDNGYRDFCLAVVKTGELEEVTRRKDNSVVAKRELVVVGLRTKTIMLTLWGDLASNEGKVLQELTHEMPIIAITYVARSTFGGLSLSTTSGSRLTINPDEVEVNKIRQWINSNEFSLNNISPPKKKISKVPMDVEEVNLSDILNCLHNDIDKVKYNYCKVWIIGVNDLRDPWYNGCKICASKVTVDGNYVECRKCGKENIEYKPRYVYKIMIKDATAEAEITLFDDEATYIIGCMAKDLEKLKNKEGNGEEFNKLIKHCIGKEYTILIKAQDVTDGNRTTRTLTGQKIRKDADDSSNPKFKKIKIEKD